MPDRRPEILPARFRDWFAARGWTPRPHQLELLAKARAGRSTLLIAPTGAGKTLAGFLPSLVALAPSGRGNAPPGGRGIHTLYVSPLKALAVDIARNLEAAGRRDRTSPSASRRAPATRPLHKRQRQKLNPPDILLTTPEQAALLLSAPDADRFFADLDTVILDELHSLVTSKRGDLLALGLARLRTLAPRLKTIGLSATVADPDALRAWLVGQARRRKRLLPRKAGEGDQRSWWRGRPGSASAGAAPSTAFGGPPPPSMHGGGTSPLPSPISSSSRAAPSPTSPSSNRTSACPGPATPRATPSPTSTRRSAPTSMTLLFVNVRSQAELIFQELWRINTEGYPIALHHGSLDATQRRKVEAAMAAGKLRAVVCTSTLDLGIDWGDVDLVVNIGAPKGASRLAQRIGRANHRLDEPSKALLVPANRFEVMECRAALDANYLGAQDTPPIRPGALDVLAQHVLGMACSAPFDADALYAEVTSAYPYRDLDRATFDRVVEFVATGGYALKTYERFAKIRQGPDGLWRITHPHVAQQYRLNVGTIIEAPLLNVRVARNRGTGLRRAAAAACSARSRNISSRRWRRGDTFLFAGLILRFEGIHENEAIATRTADDTPKIPIYAGGKFPLTTFLADGVRSLLADERNVEALPAQVADWLRIQKRRSVAAERDRAAGRDLSARQPLLHGRLSLRGPARPPDARHAAHPPAGAGASSGRSASSPPTIRSPSGGSAISAPPSRAASRPSPRSSTRTCSATISRPGWPRAISSSACSGTAR